MNLVPRNQIYDLDSLFNDLFHGFGRPALKTEPSDSMAGMRVDVHETDEEYEIHADLPGVKKDDISIILENDVLTVSASKNTESEKKEKGKVIWRERSSGSISRSFNVNPGTTQKDVKANFTDGVLTLAVPRRQPEKAKPSSQRIAIK
jgi:HSP20 family protein